MVRDRYHHGDLRGAIIAAAEHALQTTTVDSLSLRELSRMVGVSHTAPRRHFADKAALLDALVAASYRRLADVVATAASAGDVEPDRKLQAIALAYVRFATANPALTDLMSTSRYLAEASEELVHARETGFVPVLEVIAGAQARGVLRPTDVRGTATTFLALLHGLATLVNNGMIEHNVDDAVEQAVAALLAGISAPASK